MTKSQVIYRRLVLGSLYCVYGYDLIYWLLSGYSGYGTGYTNSVDAQDLGSSANTPFIGSMDNLFFLLWGSIGCCLYLLRKTKWKNNIPRSAYYFYVVLLTWNIICWIRGGLNSADYVDWKGVLTNPMGGLSAFAPVALILGMNSAYSLKIFDFFIFTLKCSFVLIPLQILRILASEESYAHIVLPVLPLLLLLPFLPGNKKVVIVLASLAAFGLTIEWRTNELRLLLLYAFIGAGYFRRYLSKSVFNIVNIIIFCVPLYFLVSGVLTGQSVFAEQSGSGGGSVVTAGDQQVDLSGDTRTLLYTEVLADLSNTNTLLFGKGTNGKYKSDIFTDDVFKNGRGNVEVGALKTLMYYGILGLALNLAILIIAVYLGTNRSNNTLTRYFAFFLALHWMLLFIENMISYNVYYYLLWIIIGLCLSKRFRELSDKDIKRFFFKPKLINRA